MFGGQENTLLCLAHEVSGHAARHSERLSAVRRRVDLLFERLRDISHVVLVSENIHGEPDGEIKIFLVTACIAYEHQERETDRMRL